MKPPMSGASRAARVRMMDARDWTGHLTAVTGGPRRVDVRVVEVRTTKGQTVKRPLWSAPN